ncbi:glycosyltransferase [Agriterribacter sp.]|uniref:glycosyltransferase family 2 protein n=1 Tax=Agriterribacter sp. TaxID=2821509 RepID=UPI002BC50534|nr:glycosyltransferase [Agriterribacter sp.]HRO45090.1 glycosyltransferase [Agriterribacter sp.]HRQ15469.1 glycosyltransferase [Agriterribacter sp.]
MEKSNKVSQKFSIILPVRNGGHLIKNCVASILAQSYQNFNLLILENKSTDGTFEWLKTITDNRVIILPSEYPMSIEENWSRIKDIPKNEFITLIGHDDVMDEHFLEEMSGLIERFPAASLYLSHYSFIDQNGKALTPCKPLKGHYSPAEFTKAILELKIEPIGAVVRSSDYDKAGGIPPYPNLLFADYALWISLASVSSAVVHPGRLFSYRIHLSTSKTTPASRYIDALFDFLQFLQMQSGKDDGIKSAILETAPGFIRFYCQSLSLRLLKTPFAKRDNKTVDSFVSACREWAQKFSGTLSASRLTKLAVLIDKSVMLSNVYLILRNISKRKTI